jgi:hypothetical protein
MRISNSFSEGEIQIMEFILQTLLRGGTPTMAARHKDFASLYRKVMSMKSRLEDKKSRASSVGTIGAVDDDPDVDLDTDVDVDDDQQQAV